MAAGRQVPLGERGDQRRHGEAAGQGHPGARARVQGDGGGGCLDGEDFAGNAGLEEWTAQG